MSGEQEVADGRKVQFGEKVFDADGNELGHIRGVDQHGFYVTTRDGVVALSSEHDAESRGGEKELMWRCWVCGAMGELTHLPEQCPDCGAPKEDLYYWQED
jgi:ABC-type ATPase with predicted acetyltransferase domain